VNKNILLGSNKKTFSFSNLKKGMEDFVERLRFKSAYEIVNDEKEVAFSLDSCGFNYDNYNSNPVISCHSPLVNEDNPKLSFSYLFLKYYYFPPSNSKEKKEKIDLKQYLKEVLDLKNNPEKLITLLCGHFIQEITLNPEKEQKNPFKALGVIEGNKKEENENEIFEKESFLKYNLNNKEIYFLLPPGETPVFKDLSINNFFIYKLNFNFDSKNNIKSVEIKEGNLDDLCSYKKEKIGAIYYNNFKLFSLFSSEKGKNLKLSDLLKDCLDKNLEFKIKKGFLFIKSTKEIVSPFGKEGINNFNDITLLFNLKGKKVKIENLKEGVYCAKKVEKEKNSLIISLKQGSC
jgi:hypothetical protein